MPYWLSRWPGGSPNVELGIWRHVGWLLVVPGLAALLWSMYEFVVRGHGAPAPIDPPRRFVATGLYRYVRNPMYVGVLSTELGEFLLYDSLNVLAYAVVMAIVFHTLC